MNIDASQVDNLIVDLRGADERVQRSARRTMKRSALEIKRKMREDFSGHSYAPRVPYSLEFKRLDRDGLAYEIGEITSSGPQWGIAAILAFGTSNNAPVVDHTAALRRETPAIIRHLGEGAEGSVLGGAK